MTTVSELTPAAGAPLSAASLCRPRPDVGLEGPPPGKAVLPQGHLTEDTILWAQRCRDLAVSHMHE